MLNLVGIKYFYYWLKIDKDLVCFNLWLCKNVVICIKCMVEFEEVDNLDVLREVV